MPPRIVKTHPVPEIPLAMRHSELIFVKKVPGKGRGVFARRPLRKGTVIERIPVVLVPIRHFVGGWDNPAVAKFGFVRDRRTVAIALGFGSLYNHSYRPNARYKDGPAATMIFTALCDIPKGAEITVNYNGNPEDQSSVGFEVIETTAPLPNGSAGEARDVPRRLRLRGTVSG
jgi:uncharacterized protein